MQEQPKSRGDGARRRCSGLAPAIAAIVLGVVTIFARQWELLSSNLPRRPDFAVFRFAPSGNEWHIDRRHGFGVDSYELRRSYTCNADADPAADASAVLAKGGLPEHSITGPAFRGTNMRVVMWGWPMRHTSLDQSGRRSYRALGFAVDALLFASVWWVILHMLRRPVAAAINYFSIPPYACRGCRYDLRGLPDDVPCPECGRAQPPSTSNSTTAT